MLEHALRGHALWARLLRFSLVGGVSTCLYGAFAWLLVDALSMRATVASVSGYLLVIPVNFMLQKIFTFRSPGKAGREASRFVLIHGMNLAISFILMYIITVSLGLDYRFGIALTMLLVPAATFIAMNRWVFGRHAQLTGSDA